MKLVRQTLALASCSVVAVLSEQPLFNRLSNRVPKAAHKVCVESFPVDEYMVEKVELQSIDSAAMKLLEADFIPSKRDRRSHKLACSSSVSRHLVAHSHSMGWAMEPTLSNDLNRSWRLLLPLISMPFLAVAFRGRDDTYSALAKKRVYLEACISINGAALNVNEYPTTNSRVLRRLENNTLIHLSGRCNNDWLELKEGGWIPSRAARLTNSLSHPF